ncbi:hypothetical protein OESDEN_09844 [Oesophagostomum dentatum]|uniref:AMP-dependent synthetase/ligase domain-containing protein n=1 Tax=Oesophagostomum dentatum TaxID=61180 RepID=A0A0B1SZA3_OESDE|nr:hypothetical protein OESDEN_09844 [Oesophagostomum dentatum]
MVFLAKHPITEQYDLSSLKVLICGAAPAGKDICEELNKKYANIKYIVQGSMCRRCPVKVFYHFMKPHVVVGKFFSRFPIAGYGMTECTMASHVPDLKNSVPFGSVGKVASNLKMKILDPSTGKEVPPGITGEICIKGPTVMLGYLGKPDATKSTIINGWLHTGTVLLLCFASALTFSFLGRL